MRKLSAIAVILALVSSGHARGGQDIEREIGKSVADEIEKEFGVVEDPLLTAWVERVGQKLAAASGRPNVKYRFKVLDSEDINAVAAPGGFIYINRGTLRFVHTEDELAAVLGHEVGHVAGRHSMKQLAAQLLGTLALIGFKAVHAETLRTVGSVAGSLAMLKFSRDEENDADRRGLREAVATGYDGQAMVQFLKRLESTEKEKPDKLEAYFLTHPPTAERVKRVSKEPGSALTAANYAALGDGCAARSLFRQAAAAYRHSLDLQPDSGINQKLAEVVRHVPARRSTTRLASADRDRALGDIAAAQSEIRAGRDASDKDRKQLASQLKDADGDLEAAARSLQEASQMIGRHDGIRQKQFVRLARAFEGAVHAAGNLRSIRDMADETYTDFDKLASSAESTIRSGDRAPELLPTCRAALQDLADGLKQARERSAQVRNGARALRRAADNLLTSYRSPFGFTDGELDILDVQVSAGSDTLSDALAASRRPEVLIARARMNLLTTRIDLATTFVRADDPAVLGVVSRYLGLTPDELAPKVQSQGYGQASVAVAQDQLRKSVAESKGKSRKSLQNEDAAIQQGLRWQNVAVLFNMIANDLEKELAR